MSSCFPKSARLVKTSEFRRVRTEGQSRGGRFLVLGFLETGSSSPARLGIVTTKRIGGAVVRNQVRRLCREIIRHHLPEVKPGTWMVVVARHSAGDASFAKMEADWLRLARRAAILSPESTQLTN